MTTNDTNSQTVQASHAGEGVIERLQSAESAIAQNEEVLELTPMIPEEVYSSIPGLLKDGCDVFTGRERDVFLTSALAVLSGCFSTVSGLYDQKEMHANLFAMIIADAASGKGIATHGRDLAQPIHDAMMKAEGENAATARPFIIPGNSSSAAIIKHLSQSSGIGLIFETEIDTLTSTLKQDWAGHSDLFRKAFHHEPVSYSRKLNNEYIEISAPQPSMVLTGTPGQAITLLGSAENGLVSRFMFYAYRVPPVWKDVFAADGVNLTAHFKTLSERTYKVAETVCRAKVSFKMTTEQQAKFHDTFTARMEQIKAIDGDVVSSLKRLGLIAFRIAMVLSVIRAVQGDNAPAAIVCADVDFNAAMLLSGVYLEHALYVVGLLPRASQMQGSIERLYAGLPPEFDTRTAKNVGSRIGIKDRAVGYHLIDLIAAKRIEKVRHGHYKKV